MPSVFNFMPCNGNFAGIPSSHHSVNEDDANLAKMHPALVQNWAMAQIDDCMQRIRYLKIAYNAAAPLHRTLPAEVLMEIFGRLEPHTRAGKGTAYLHVCRLWRTLVLRTAEFWVHALRRKHNLDNAGDRCLFDMAVAAVAGTRRPVSVTLHGLPPPALQSLSAHAPRLTALAVTVGTNDMSGLRTLLEGSVPLLESLSVFHRLQYRSASPVQLPLTRTSLPRLRSLEHPFGTLAVDRAYQVDLPLQRLALFVCPCDVCDAARDVSLACVLTHCASTLRVLRLRRVLYQQTLRSAPTTDAPTPRFMLPALCTLDVEDNRYEIPGLLDETHIAYPATCSVEVRGMDDRFESSLRHYLPRELASYSRVAAADEVRLVYTYQQEDTSRHDPVLDTYIAGSRRLRVVLGQPMFWRSALRDLTSIMSSSGNTSVQTLVIDVDTRYIPRDDYEAEAISALLLAFPQLRRLSFGRGDFRKTILPLLMRAPDDRDPLFPKLEELRVTWRCTQVEHSRTKDGFDLAEFCDVVAEMLQRRREQGCPLKKLHIDAVQILIAPPSDSPLWNNDMAGVKEYFRRHIGKLLEGLDVSCVVDGDSS
ncbi:hypothetical protein C8Q80DRAFT_1276012 [Daedaleopsis nitida]|nr:hypothetical protein C8Q80DRAFT_1276012 [Daedaleopsis nitida]